MSATADARSKRAPWSWRAPGRRRRAVLVAVMMAGVGLGSPGVTAAGAAGASHGVPTSSPEAAAINADASRLASQYRGNRPGLQEAGRAGLKAGRNDATVAEFLKLGWAHRLSAALERHGAMLDSVNDRQVALGVAGIRYFASHIHTACSEPARAG